MVRPSPRFCSAAGKPLTCIVTSTCIEVTRVLESLQPVAYRAAAGPDHREARRVSRRLTFTAAELLGEAIDSGMLDTHALLVLAGLDPSDVDTETTSLELNGDVMTITLRS